MPTVTAAGVMDKSAAFLNDTGLTLYTYAVQLPYLKIANTELEQILISLGTQQQKVKTTTMSYTALASTITLPTDLLVPLKLWDRESGSTIANWNPLTERDFEPEQDPVVGLTYWAYRNNNIYFSKSSTNRDVQIQYERMLSIVSSTSSNIDDYLLTNYLASRTAEMCARFIGMNETVANSIRDNEVGRASDALYSMLVLGEQGTPARRQAMSSRIYSH